MAIVDSLKNLLKKFGGDPSALEENATSSDVIDAISEAYTDKEGTYTEVTPIENSGTKIATITTNNVAHDIYTGKNDYYLANSVSGTSVTLTRDTLANIASLYLSGKQILLEIFSGGIKSILSLSTQDITISPDPEDPPTYTYVFTGIFVDGDDNKIITVTFDNSTTGTMAVKTVPSSGGFKIFNVSIDTNNGKATLLDSTAKEIYDTFHGGVMPILLDGNEASLYNLVKVAYNDQREDGYYLWFSNVLCSSSSVPSIIAQSIYFPNVLPNATEGTYKSKS